MNIVNYAFYKNRQGQHVGASAGRDVLPDEILVQRRQSALAEVLKKPCGLGFGVGETLRSPPVEDVGVVKGRHYVKQRLMAAERVAFQAEIVRQPVGEQVPG